MFDNRELALLVWAAGLLVLAIIARSIRPALVAVIDALFEPKLLTTFILMAMYAGVLVWLLSLARIWTPSVAAETFFWFFGPAIVLYSQFDKAGRDPHFFRRTGLAILTVTVVIEFLINLYPFHLMVELLLVPLMALIGGMLALAAEPQYRQIKGLLEFLLGVLGFALIGYTILHIVDAPEEFITLDNLRRFLVPILLSLSFLPFVYGVAVVALYDSLFSRLDWKPGGKVLPAYAKRQIFRAALFRLRTVQRFSDAYEQSLMRASSQADIDRAIQEIKAA